MASRFFSGCGKCLGGVVIAPNALSGAPGIFRCRTCNTFPHDDAAKDFVLRVLKRSMRLASVICNPTDLNP